MIIIPTYSPSAVRSCFHGDEEEVGEEEEEVGEEEEEEAQIPSLCIYSLTHHQDWRDYYPALSIKTSLNHKASALLMLFQCVCACACVCVQLLYSGITAVIT